MTIIALILVFAIALESSDRLFHIVIRTAEKLCAEVVYRWVHRQWGWFAAILLNLYTLGVVVFLHQARQTVHPFGGTLGVGYLGCLLLAIGALGTERVSTRSPSL